jgi:hypothetical protein
MSVVQLRGGIPLVFRDSIDGTGRDHRFGSNIFWIKARNKGAVLLRMYFLESDFTGDRNYVEIPPASASEPYGEWEGPVELVAADARVWLKSTGAASAVEVVGFQRRG